MMHDNDSLETPQNDRKLQITQPQNIFRQIWVSLMFSAYIGANLQSLVEFGDFCYQGHFVTSTPRCCNSAILPGYYPVISFFAIVLVPTWAKFFSEN